jgi:uncharacterized protein (TIGR02266 family)
VKILLVDDVPMYVELLREPLAHRGYAPVVATSAAEARAIATAHAPHLAFVDLHMPGEPGDRLCRALLASGLFVVVMGTRGRDDDRHRAEEAGCHLFLSKPVRPAEALAAAERFLRVGARQPRVPLRVEVRWEAAGAAGVGQAANVSRGGLFVATPRPAAAGSRVVLEFRLPLDRGAVLRLPARVCWVSDRRTAGADTEPGMGLAFDALAPEALAALDRFVDRSLSAVRVGAARPAAAARPLS